MSAVVQPTSTDISATIARLEQSLADVLYAVQMTPRQWLYRSPWQAAFAKADPERAIRHGLVCGYGDISALVRRVGVSSAILRLRSTT